MNSSGWPSQLAKLLPGAEALHLNTIEGPVYWENVEPQQGQFSFDTFDGIIRLAREHKVHLVVLWFGIWKNGTMDYAPAWVKTDTKRFPRRIDNGGHPVRVLSPVSEASLNANRNAYSQLMTHLREVDGDQHTVILVQVENETGSLFTDRDYSPEANQKFAGPVPAELVQALHKQPGTWKQFLAPTRIRRFRPIMFRAMSIPLPRRGRRSIPCCLRHCMTPREEFYAPWRSVSERRCDAEHARYLERRKRRRSMRSHRVIMFSIMRTTAECSRRRSSAFPPPSTSSVLMLQSKRRFRFQ